ncbi:MAG: hypothetical protein R2751_16145 [Bacteroidales bacterium]
MYRTDGNDNEESFEIQRSVNSTTNYSAVATLAAGTTSWSDTDTDNGNTYYYRIRSYNISGFSTYSNVTSVTVNYHVRSGTIGADQTLCPEGDPALLTSVSPSNRRFGNWTYQWQSSTGGAAFVNIAGATGLNYNPPASLLPRLSIGDRLRWNAVRWNPMWSR